MSTRCAYLREYMAHRRAAAQAAHRLATAMTLADARAAASEAIRHQRAALSTPWAVVVRARMRAGK
jgi:hypothetical protein